MAEKKPVLEAISKVMHPAINCSLTELGIVKDLEIYDENIVIATFVFPFQKIPIKENSERNTPGKRKAQTSTRQARRHFV